MMTVTGAEGIFQHGQFVEYFTCVAQQLCAGKLGCEGTNRATLVFADQTQQFAGERGELVDTKLGVEKQGGNICAVGKISHVVVGFIQLVHLVPQLAITVLNSSLSDCSSSFTKSDQLTVTI